MPKQTKCKLTSAIREFTLIELLIVVAILTILASLLLPAIQRALQTARSTTCVNNEKQMLLGFQYYTDDYDGRLPFRIDPFSYIGPYFGDSGLAVDPKGYEPLEQLLCPQDRQLLCTPGDFGTLLHGGSYGYNQYGSHLRLDTLTEKHILIGECATIRMLGTIWLAGKGDDRWNSYTPWAHFGGAGPLSDLGKSNYGFADMHIETFPMEPAAGNTLSGFRNAAVEGLWYP